MTYKGERINAYKTINTNSINGDTDQIYVVNLSSKRREKPKVTREPIRCKFNNLDKVLSMKKVNFEYKFSVNNHSSLYPVGIVKTIFGIANFCCLLVYSVLKINIAFLHKNLSASVPFSARGYTPYSLDLIFLRNRFFPQLATVVNSKTIFNNSLGIISGYFSKKKSFLRSKSSYLMLAAYVRRMLVSMGLFRLRLKVKGLPLHLRAILKTILGKSNVLYKDPYNPEVLKNEMGDSFSFSLTFSQIVFMSNKFYGTSKVKQRGRLKRKISKRIINTNSILD